MHHQPLHVNNYLRRDTSNLLDAQLVGKMTPQIGIEEIGTLFVLEPIGGQRQVTRGEIMR
jgi:hypothetical protein